MNFINLSFCYIYKMLILYIYKVVVFFIIFGYSMNRINLKILF